MENQEEEKICKMFQINQIHANASGSLEHKKSLFVFVKENNILL